jgi:hypothetical protein
MEIAPSIQTRNFPRNSETAAICAELDQFVGFLAKYGHRARPYREGSIAHFNSLEPIQRRTILANFRAYADLCASIESAGVSFKNIPDLARFVVGKLGLNGPRSFFEGLGSENIVEIYNSEGVQVFRNFVFYDFCSYTLLDLISYPWFELLERHASVNEKIGKLIAEVMGDCNDVIADTLGPHNMRELFSEEKRIFRAQFVCFAPLFEGPGVKKGFICSGRLSFIPHDPQAVSFISGRA